MIRYLPYEEHLKEVSKNGHALMNVPHEQRNREMILAAVSTNGHALQHVRSKQTFEIVLTALNTNPCSIVHVSPVFTSNLEFMIMLCQHFKNTFAFAHDSVCYDIRLVTLACLPLSQKFYNSYDEESSFYSYRQQINNVFHRFDEHRVKEMADKVLDNVRHFYNNKMMAKWLFKSIIDAHPLSAHNYEVVNSWRTLIQLPRVNTNNASVPTLLTEKCSALYANGMYFFANIVREIMSYLNLESYTLPELRFIMATVGQYS